MSDLFDYDNKLSNLVDHDNKNCKSCIEYEDRLIKQLNELKTENKTLKEFADKLDEEFGKNVEPTLSEKADNIIALYRTNKKYCEIADEKIKELQKQLDQANERLMGAIVPKFEIGQKVWSIFVGDYKEICYLEITHIMRSKSGIFYQDNNKNAYWFNEKNTFLTEQEAQAKLQELRGEE